MEKLTKINKSDLQFSGAIDDNGTNTYLSLDDYDWMNYKLRTAFQTEALGTLEVTFEYFGATTSVMTVKQRKTRNKIYIHKMEFDTDIFQKYIKRFLTEHLATWDTASAFNGKDIVIDFYNEVIDKGKYSED